MNLFILTNSDGSPIADKTVAAVVSVTDTTQVQDLGDLLLGDSEPIVLKFTTGTAAPAFAGDATYTPSLSLGLVTVDGSCNFAAVPSWTVTTGGWTGRLPLTGTNLAGTASALGGNWIMSPPYSAGPSGCWMAIQIRVTNPASQTATFALLRVYVEWAVT